MRRPGRAALLVACVLGLVPPSVSVATADDPGERRADDAPARVPPVQDPRDPAPVEPGPDSGAVRKPAPVSDPLTDPRLP